MVEKVFCAYAPRFWLWCYVFGAILSGAVEGASLQEQNGGASYLKDQLGDWYAVVMVAAGCTGLLLTVLLLALCGGCTEMEVGSEQHAACGPRKSGGGHAQYDSVATDVNTHVMSAGHTMAGDPYENQDPGLPYPVHPQTANTFTGYAQQQQPAYGGSSQGYGTAPSAPRPGAHMPVGSSEPPPPNYYEAVRSGDPPAAQQSYAW